jgi:hypothetical protein
VACATNSTNQKHKNSDDSDGMMRWFILNSSQYLGEFAQPRAARIALAS